MKILYIIPRMTYGGGMPTIITEVKHIRQMGLNFTGTIVSMERSVSTDMMTDALAIGLKVLLAPSMSLLAKLISSADLTVVQYWNCPSMYRLFSFLASAQVPHRLCLSVRVNGCTLPQVVPTWVYAACDALIQIHPRTPAEGLRDGIQRRTIPSLIRLPETLTPPEIPSFNTFKLFHAGTLNYFKVHPRLIGLHEGLKIPNYCFDIWGAGMDTVFEADVAKASHAVFRGFSKNMYADMTPYHLLCNPQTALSYSSFDKIMRESQWMGKPVVVLKNSYIADYVSHNVNGIIAEDEYEYRASIEYLAANPNAYKKLAETTLEHTRSQYKLTDYVTETVLLYEQTISLPLKTLEASSVPENPANAALDGLGNWKNQFLTSPETLSKMELDYALRCEGGLYHFYKEYPDNLPLRNLITNLITAGKETV